MGQGAALGSGPSGDRRGGRLNNAEERDKLIATAQWQIRLTCQTLQQVDTCLERMKGVDMVRIVVEKQSHKKRKKKVDTAGS